VFVVAAPTKKKPTKPKPGEMTAEEQSLLIRRRTERLIGTRERSEAELRSRLLRAGFDEDVVQREVARCIAAGLVDDERFARLYIAGKKRSGWGCRRIEQELLRFGIELRACEDYPAAFFNEDDEFERACACLARFHSSARDQQAARFRRLLSKGFSTQIAQRALRER
jgi:regulatory protein